MKNSDDKGGTLRSSNQPQVTFPRERRSFKTRAARCSQNKGWYCVVGAERVYFSLPHVSHALPRIHSVDGLE